MNKPSRRLWIVAAIAVACIVLLSLANRDGGAIVQGSTFSRTPSGYGAWYAEMEARGVEIGRWQRSPERLRETADGTGTVFLQVVPPGLGVESVLAWEDWLSAGNTLIVLGVPARARAPVFASELPSDRGLVEIETRRRHSLQQDETELLGDESGALVWEEPYGEGRVIRAATPFLAANAYQDAPGNFAFLVDLAATDGGKIWVDEYLHGYREAEDPGEEAEGVTNAWTYLARTPWLLVLVQTIAISLLATIGYRRLGKPATLTPPAIDNSAAYTEALAGVLQRANSASFVVETLSKAERLRLQKALGLGPVLADAATLTAAWVRHTNGSAADLQALLYPPPLQRSRPLAAWLKSVQSLSAQSERSNP